MARALVLCVLGAVCSCSLLDTGDLAGGAPEDLASNSDSGSDVIVGGDTDASVDGGIADSGGSDGCLETIVDGFDTGPLGAQWSSVLQSGATLTFDPAEKVVGASALLFQLTAVDGRAYLAKQFPKAKSVCCEMSLRTSGPDAARFLRFTRAAQSYDLVFTWVLGKVQLGEQATGINRISGLFTYPSTTWFRFRVEISLGPGTTKGTVKVFMDGSLTLQDSLGDTTHDFSIDTMELGSSYSQGAVRKTWFDDLSCGTR